MFDPAHLYDSGRLAAEQIAHAAEVTGDPVLDTRGYGPWIDLCGIAPDCLEYFTLGELTVYA